MNILFRNIGLLGGICPDHINRKAGKEMRTWETIADAWLSVDGNKISGFGNMGSCPEPEPGTEVIDARGRLLMPGFVDSHTHIVFATSRQEEFVHRIEGLSYEEIARRGGGILNSARKLQACSEDELFASAWERLEECMRNGSTSMEIKSGYGLTVADELKMLRVIARLKAQAPIQIKATFLGAHAIPAEYKENRNAYLELIERKMLPVIASGNLAEYMDVFCDQGFFTVAETDRLLSAAAGFGLKPKIHANELGYTGGVQIGIKHGALSVDHLEFTGEAEIQALLQSNTMPVALPGCSFFLGIPYSPVREMMDAGLPVALASDYNPGSSPCGRMQFIMALGCIRMKMHPYEALNAVTLNAAAALELSHITGSIALNKRADLVLTKPAPDFALLAYYHNRQLIDRVWAAGTCITA